MGQIHDLLRRMVEIRASDIAVKVGAPPAMRVDGRWRFEGSAPISEGAMESMFHDVTTDKKRKQFEDDGETESIIELADAGRFRGNIFRQRGLTSMVYRHIKSRIPSLDELMLPADVLRRLALKPRGLVLLTGVAGSGKSTTLASMIQYVNETAGKHIITIEDPIEYTFTDAKSVVEQREIGPDTETFATALKHVLRQAPDIILIGEMRDKDTMEAALNAAETGHLVLSTLHSPNAMQTMDRVVQMFPPHQYEFLRLQMSMLLEGVISQRLLARRDGEGRVPAVEVMAASPTVREMLAEGRTRDLYKAIKEGKYYGCQTFNQSLKSLLDADIIELEDAMNAADSPDELRLELRGISKDVGNDQAPAARGGGGGVTKKYTK